MSPSCGGSRRTRGLAILGLVGLAIAACAKVGPPPGGPEDRDAPTIVPDAVRPAPGAAGVGIDSTVFLVFSEPPDRRSVMRALAVFPPVDFRETSWRGDTLTLVPDPGWAPGRNTILRIGPTARDQRGNALAEPFVLRFTTKALADSGTIRGRVWAGRERTSASRVVVFATPADTAAGASPAAVAEPDKEGAFTLEGVDTGATWRVTALIDADGDAHAGGRGEATGDAAEIVSFAPDTREATVPDFLVGTLDSIGHIRGQVAADSGVTVFVVAQDVVSAATAKAGPLPGGGAYSLDVPTGTRYRVTAFVDVDGNGERDEAEPSAEGTEELRLDLASERTGINFDLKKASVPKVGEPGEQVAPRNEQAAPPDSGEGQR